MHDGAPLNQVWVVACVLKQQPLQVKGITRRHRPDSCLLARILEAISAALVKCLQVLKRCVLGRLMYARKCGVPFAAA